MDKSWDIKRGSKIIYSGDNQISDFENIEKSIIMVIDIQIKDIVDNFEELNLPNKFGKWILL